MTTTPQRLSRIDWCAFVVVLTIVAFTPVLRNEFTYDDLPAIVDNPDIPSLLSPKVYFSHDYFRLSREATYRPLVTASYALDYWLWGLKSFGFRFQNLAWQCAACVMLFFLCRSLGAPEAVSAICAALYAVHPIQSEAVCAAGFREDLMCAAFYFAALALWPSARRPTPQEQKAQGRERLRLAGSLACLVLALLSKEMALSFPLLAMAKEWRAARLAGDSPVQRLGARAPRYALVWLIVIGALAGFLIFAAPTAATNRPMPTPLIGRVLGFLLISVRYLRLLAVPYPLRAEYQVPMTGEAFLFSSLGAAIALAALGTLCFSARRRVPFVWESFVAFFLLLGPVSNVIPLLHPMAERYLTLPAAAFYWAAANALFLIARVNLRRAVTGAALAVCVGLTWMRVADWRSQITLWTYEIRHGSDSYVAHYNLGLNLGKAGQNEEATDHLNKAIAARPDIPDPHVTLGVVLGNMGKGDEAIAQYKEALRLQPEDTSALNDLGAELGRQNNYGEAIKYFAEVTRLKPDWAMAHQNYGYALEMTGKIEEAIAEYQAAVRCNRDYFEAHYKLGLTLAKQGQLEGAVQHFSEALRIEPTAHEAHNNLGIALRKMGRIDEAIERYREALRLKPDYAGAYHNLALALLSQGNSDEAIREFQKAIKNNPDYLEAHFNLANELDGSGRKDEALLEYAEALRIKPDLPQAHEAIASILESQGKWEEAASHWRAIIKGHPATASGYLGLGKTLAKQGMKEDARAQYREALSRAEADQDTTTTLEARRELETPD